MGERFWISNFSMNDVVGGTEILGNRLCSVANLKYISHGRVCRDKNAGSIWEMSANLDNWLRRVPEIDVLFRNSVNGLTFVENKPNIKKDIVVCCENFGAEARAGELFENPKFTVEKEQDYIKQKQAISTADKVVVLSKGEYYAFLPYVEREKLSIIEPYIETKMFHGLYLRNHNARPKAIFVGRAHPRKGFDIFLKLANEFKNIDFTCVIPEYKRFCYTGPLYPNIEFKGDIENSELSYTYAQSDFLIMPSRYESFGFVYAEAMAHGVPVVTTRVGMFKEYDKELYDNNFVSEDFTVDGLSEKIYDFLDAKNNKRIDRDRIKKLALDRFTKDRFVRDINGLLSDG